MGRCYDGCCKLTTQRCIKRWLIRFVIVFLLASVLSGTVLLILRFVVTVQVKVYVEDARLNSFAFATTQTDARTSSFFAYNISVALTLRNLNGAMSIKYTEPLLAAFLFYDRRLYNVTVVDKGHKHRPGRREEHLLLNGGEVQPYELDAGAVKEFRKQNATGVFKVEMRISGELTLGIGNNHKLDLSCPLTMPLASTGPDVVEFHEVNCVPDKPEKIIF